ncbi:MAG: hypothetical protein LKE37_05100 [Atopobiaceae bacterium]|jgi:hypothetical protein|nr:hypothetical protein [Atopobiaceae bacterium]
MSKIKTSLKSRRIVRKNREFFETMTRYGLTADELRAWLLIEDRLRMLGRAVCVSLEDAARKMSDAARALNDSYLMQQHDSEDD